MLIVLTENVLRVFQFQTPHISEADFTTVNFLNPEQLPRTWIKERGLFIPTSCNPLLNSYVWFMDDSQPDQAKINNEPSPGILNRLDGLWLNKEGKPHCLLSGHVNQDYSVLPLTDNEWLLTSNTSLSTEIRNNGSLYTDDIIEICRQRVHCLNTITVYTTTLDQLQELVTDFTEGKITAKEFSASWHVTSFSEDVNEPIELNRDELTQFTFNNLNAW